jgi:hypothetical protein
MACSICRQCGHKAKRCPTQSPALDLAAEAAEIAAFNKRAGYEAARYLTPDEAHTLGRMCRHTDRTGKQKWPHS